MISKSELLQGRDLSFPQDYNDTISDNLDSLLVALNMVRTAYAKPMKVTSGWRPASINGMIKGASIKSNHIVGLACDFLDTDGSLFKWCVENLQLLKDNKIYLEDARWTRTATSGWVHMQLVRPSSGKRIFVPNQSLCPYPKFWDGKYDTKWDK